MHFMFSATSPYVFTFTHLSYFKVQKVFGPRSWIPFPSKYRCAIRDPLMSTVHVVLNKLLQLPVCSQSSLAL